MEKILLRHTDDTPNVLLDKAENRIVIAGKSFPEDAEEFYYPIMDWLKAYIDDPNEKTEVQFQFDYFNTASQKKILEILLLLQKLSDKGNNVCVKWIYKNGDEDIRDAGRKFQNFTTFKFDILSL